MTKTIPLTEQDFKWVKMTPKEMKRIAGEFIQHKKEDYSLIQSISKEERTYINTLYALERSDDQFNDLLRGGYLLGEVSPKKEIREASHQLHNEISPKMIDLEYNPKLYQAVLDYFEGNFKKEKKNLSQDDIKLLTDTIREYKRMGFALPADKQKKLKALLKKSSKLSNDFRKNINDYQDYILCTREELDGLSENIISSLPKDEKSKKYMVTLQYPHIGPFMQFAKNREKRKELALKNLKKGGQKNLTIIKDLIEVRKEISKILGYKHYADYKAEDRMAKKGENIEKLQNDLLKKLIVPAKKDMDTLKAHAKTLGISKLEFFDISYVANDLQKKLYDVDPEIVREYFPLDHVMEEMFSLYGKLFGVTFTKLAISLWHKDAIVYEVKNIDKTLVGYLLFDLFPRDGKYGHAMCVDVVVTREASWKSDEAIAPVTTIVCNFPIPTKKTPSLLTIREVETLFHEFGHAVHMTFSKSRYESQASGTVAWDFIETPSQIMENWVWHDAMLERLSKHFKTGQSLPKEMREKILKGKKFLVAETYMRQILMGKFDYDFHIGKIKNPSKAWRDMLKKYLQYELPEKETLFPAGFGHLGGGYDAGYYSYLWALVYACDAFSLFEKHGITNPEIGMRWRKEVLEKGSSVDEMKLITNFLGRKPSQKAFLKEIIGK